MSNIIDLTAMRAARDLPPENDRSFELSVGPRQLPVTGSKRRRSATSMHTFVFRSYELIITSPEADLVRDVRCDVHKARTKLRKIREQMDADRKHAAARADLLTKAEAKLSAAIAQAFGSVEG
ncbi:hypothetical protein JQ621_03065 [Bradyrhizobium manausense]|uniref:hypothetical protein n=1 Tax=Bradyrhizobium manausense TaxID=989370 RepID=UPI001BADB66F|nr:hypothetical protein [Bradyrhizobium manausense]MBR1086449.1 hypothetical protein [Bradyrhizobium manausense]